MSVENTIDQFNQLLLETTMTRSFVSSSLASAICDCLAMSNCTFIKIDGSKLGSTRITDEYLDCLLESLLGAHIALETLILKNNRITSLGVINSVSKYICLGTLRYLDLEGNDLDGHCIPYFALSEPDCPLSTLNISCNPQIAAAGGMVLADALLVNHRLQHLYVNNCGFDLTTIIAIIAALRENFRMETVEMDRPLLTSRQEEQSDHISRLLLQPSSFTTLSLRHSRIGDFGCKLIADSLTRNYTLTRLNLESNRIGVAGAEALASYLIMASSRGLVSLKLSYNEVGNAGCLALAEALQSNTTLRELTLKSNKINVALSKLGAALYDNNTLSSLSLFGNDFNQESGKIFSELISNRLIYVGLELDIKVYKVDGNFMIAEI